MLDERGCSGLNMAVTMALRAISNVRNHEQSSFRPFFQELDTKATDTHKVVHSSILLVCNDSCS